MTDIQQHQTMIDQFGAHYAYDTQYMRNMLEHHPQAFAAFAAFLPMANFRQDLPRDVYFVAKLAAMQVADCSACLQLTVKMALEADVAADLVQAVLKEGDLPNHLAAVNRFARTVAHHHLVADEDLETMRSTYGETGLIELALAIASTGVFPLIKRSFGMLQSCQVADVSMSFRR